MYSIIKPNSASIPSLSPSFVLFHEANAMVILLGVHEKVGILADFNHCVLLSIRFLQSRT
jgi:hypothetical protein